MNASKAKTLSLLRNLIGTVRLPRPRRLVPPLWGTTTLSDCMAILAYLAPPVRLVNGPAIQAYEEAFARATGTRFGISFATGRLGLYGILRGIGIAPGDEVLLQVPTHVVVADAIRYAGAKPVFVDCRRDTLNMDLVQAERLITPWTKAIVLQHTFGVPADIDGALSLAQRQGLQIIEDCVHALGAKYRGQTAGSFGIAAFFSTEETKVISSMMGGMAVTDDPGLARKLRDFQRECKAPSAFVSARYLAKVVLYHFAGHPLVHPYTYPVYTRLRRMGRLHLSPPPTSDDEQLGRKPANYEQRLSNGQATIALRQLGRLDANLRHRRRLAALYQRRLAEHGIDGYKPEAGSEPSFLRYPVWVKDPAAVQDAVERRAVLGEWFRSVLEESTSPDALGYEGGSCPVAEQAIQHLVNLPTHPRTTAGDAEEIVSQLASVEARDVETPATS